MPEMIKQLYGNAFRITLLFHYSPLIMQLSQSSKVTVIGGGFSISLPSL